jgi:enoyl-CoA hydratase
MIRFDASDGVAEILLDNPPVNAITDALMDAMMAALCMAGSDPRVRAIVLGSAVPGRFCARLDLPRFKDSSPAEVHASVGRLYSQLFELQSGLPKPTIAAISGAVHGGGVSIAITCDMLVAADDASFGYPEMKSGCCPPSTTPTCRASSAATVPSI